MIQVRIITHHFIFTCRGITRNIGYTVYGFELHESSSRNLDVCSLCRVTLANQSISEMLSWRY